MCLLPNLSKLFWSRFSSSLTSLSADVEIQGKKMGTIPIKCKWRYLFGRHSIEFRSHFIFIFLYFDPLNWLSARNGTVIQLVV